MELLKLLFQDGQDGNSSQALCLFLQHGSIPVTATKIALEQTLLLKSQTGPWFTGDSVVRSVEKVA